MADEPTTGEPTTGEPSAGEPSAEDPTERLEEAVRVAAQRSALGRVAPGEAPTGQALWAAMGGVRGIVESILPGLLFLVVFAITHQAVFSVLAPVAIALVFLVVRIVRREPMSGAIAGFVGIALSAGFALITGNARDNFVLGFFINGGLALIALVSMLARWPLVGLLVGILAGDHPGWRGDRAKLRVAYIATSLFLAFPLLRLGVELPLYFAGQTEGLATTKLILGVPLYAAVLWVTWLLVRSAWNFTPGAEKDTAAEGTR